MGSCGTPTIANVSYFRRTTSFLRWWPLENTLKGPLPYIMCLSPLMW